MTLDRRGTYVDKDGNRRTIPVTVVTKADCDLIAEQARKITIDPHDYLAGEFDRWPLDRHVHENHSIIIEEGNRNEQAPKEEIKPTTPDATLRATDTP